MVIRSLKNTRPACCRSTRRCTATEAGKTKCTSPAGGSTVDLPGVQNGCSRATASGRRSLIFAARCASHTAELAAAPQAGPCAGALLSAPSAWSPVWSPPPPVPRPGHDGDATAPHDGRHVSPAAFVTPDRARRSLPPSSTRDSCPRGDQAAPHHPTLALGYQGDASCPRNF